MHFPGDDEKGEVIEEVAVDGKAVNFAAPGFSVYAVIGGTEPTARMQVNFHAYDENGNEKVTTMYVKNEDSAEALEMILYDPGVGKLEDGELFRGWTLNEDYTAAQGSTSYNKTTNPNGAMTIDDVREWAKDRQAEEIEEDPMQVYDFYPVILKHYTVTYLDRFGVSIDTASAYLLCDDTEAEFTINYTYETNDEDYHFKGWISNDQDKITLDAPEGGQAPDLEQVDILDDLEYTNNPYNLYKNNTKVKISDNVTLKAHAPKGKWLIFHEVEKGATYVAPQFLEEGENADMPNPSNMYLLGYRFAGWYKGDPIYGDDGVTVIGATPNYSEDHKYNGEPIDQKHMCTQSGNRRLLHRIQS